MSDRATGSAATTFLVAVATFVAGLAFGWMLFGSDSPPDAPATSVAAPVAAPVPTPATRQERTALRAPDGDAAEVERPVAEAMKVRFDFPSFTGTGVIRGTVKSDTGEPVAGVEVLAFADTPSEWEKETSGRRWEEIPIEESLLRTARTRRWWDASRKQAVSGTDGTFELTGLADLKWWVEARADGWSIDGDTYNEARAGAVVDFKASRSVKFDVDVRLPDGSAAADARLHWTAEGSDSTSNWGWTRGGGPAWMKPGKWRVAATSGEDDRYTSPPTDVEIAPGMGQLVLALRSRPGIVVVAKRPEGFDGLRLYCYVARADETDPTDDELRAARSGSSPRPWARDRGPFSEGLGDTVSAAGRHHAFLDLAPGRWIVAAGFEGMTLARRAVVVSDAVVDCELAVPAPDSSQFLEVRVAGPDGAAVAATFRWEYRSEQGTREHSSAEAIERTDGDWLVQRARPGGSADRGSRSRARDQSGRWYLCVDVDGFVRQETEVASTTTRVDVRMATPAIALVRLTGLPQGMAAMRFSAAIVDDRSAPAHGEMDAEGSTKLAPLAPGRHEIWLTLQYADGASLTIARRTVDLVAGENAVEIAVPEMHPLDLDLGAARAGDDVFITPSIEVDLRYATVISISLDSAGRAKLDPVPAGSYRLRCRDDDEDAWHEFRVPETRTFKLP